MPQVVTSPYSATRESMRSNKDPAELNKQTNTKRICFSQRRLDLWSHGSADIWYTSSRGFPGGTVIKNPLTNAGGVRDVEFIFWRRKWQPTVVFLPGESQGQKNLVGYSPGGCKEPDTAERTHPSPGILVLLFYSQCSGVVGEARGRTGDEAGVLPAQQLRSSGRSKSYDETHGGVV